MSAPPRFGDLLARLLAERHLTQRAFATAAGVPPSFVNKILAGQRGVPAERIEAWADRLELAGDGRDRFIGSAILSGMSARQRAWVATSLGGDAQDAGQGMA